MISSEIFSIIGPALLAGLIITITHAPLGIEVLKRGIIFIDLAVAQIAGLGLLVSNLYLSHNLGWLSQIVALMFAIIAAFFFKMIENRIKSQQEAIIGVSFVLAASIAILLLADHPTGGEEIRHLLSGQMLFITWPDVFLHLPIYILILDCILGSKSEISASRTSSPLKKLFENLGNNSPRFFLFSLKYFHPRAIEDFDHH